MVCGGLDFTNIINSASINTNFLQSFQNELMKRLSPMSLVSNLKDKFTDPNVLIDFAKNGVKTAITGGPAAMTSSIMNNIKGMGIDQVQNQLGELTSIFNSDNSKKSTNDDIISSMNDFIKEKADIYKQITNQSVPNLDN